MRYIFCFFLFINFLAQAQNKVTGIIKDKENNQPISGASVFLNNTSIGTASTKAGTFELSVPPGKFDLVISSIGYETYTTTILTATAYLNVFLLPKAKELATVIIEPAEINGWANWGKFFIESFIGTSSYAAQCTIKNYKVIKFRNSKKPASLQRMHRNL